jgi:dTDP-4-dehydrorhamnose reductase
MFLDESRADLVLSSRQDKLLFAGVEDEHRISNYIQLDMTDRASVRSVILSLKPDVIVNCAAFVDVDRAESERETAWRTNVSAIEYLIESARKTEARIIHISSDFVFDGTKTPYAENAKPNPLNYYGRTKLASENALRASGVHHCILRVPLLYGLEELQWKNMAMRVYDSLQKKKQFAAFTDIQVTPTLIDDLAFAVTRAAELRKHGIYHVGGPEMVSRYEFAVRVAKHFKLDESLIVPITSEGNVAIRPKKSAFVTLKAQTELSLRLAGIDQGLEVTYRNIKDIVSPSRQIVYS